MFRIEFFCDDRKVGDALRGLMGIAVGTPTAQPVINAQKTHTGKIQAKTNGNLVEQFAHYIANSKLETISTKEVGDWLKKLGMSPLSVSYVTKQSIAQGLLKRTSPGHHDIIRALPKPKKGGARG